MLLPLRRPREAAANRTQRRVLPAFAAVTAVVIAISANAAFKLTILRVVAGEALLRRVAPTLGVMVGAAWPMLAVQLTPK